MAAKKKPKKSAPKKGPKSLTHAERIGHAKAHVATSRKVVKVSGYTRGWPTKKRGKK
jgi:hypothetical protein